MNDRNETIKAIKSALERRSGKKWSVTGGRGTGWGWITIEAPPSRRTWGHRYRLKSPGAADTPENYEAYDTGEPGRGMSPADCAELAALMGLDRPTSTQGISIPSSSAYYAEYIDRANGRTPVKVGSPYWD